MTRRLLTPILVPLVLAACGVAVEQSSLPRTSAPQIGSETETAAAPQPEQPAVIAGDEVATDDEAVDMASLAPSVTGSIDGLIEMIEEEAETEQAAAEDAAAEPSAQPETPDSEQVAATEDEAPVAADEAGAADQAALEQEKLKEESAAEAVGNIIWNLEAANRGRAAPEPEPVVPVGPDPSLATEALEAAFAMLARRDQGLETGGFIMPPKPGGTMRIALLIPKSGENAVLGNELQRGAELALFSLRNSAIELLVFDTVEKGADVAAREAVVAESDIIVGPLFSDAVVPARQVAATHGVPMLALSNNTAIAGRGSWLFGYLPEQQVDILLGHALTAGRSKVGIIAADDVFGQKLARHARKRLGQFGLEPEDFVTLTAAQLASEDELKDAVKRFTGYTPPADDEETPAASELPPPRFDAVLFAGSADFALRTAPVLAYYDADPERVLYLGNAQWNQRRILMEPSLQGGLFASRPTDRDDAFNALWSSALGGRPGALARLSFDAMAMAAILAGQERETWNAALEAGSGYNGFSGAYRLMPDGGNRRSFEIRQVNGGVSTIFQPAPDKI
ncbi:MAG: penicillin-binding protein activator [Pseudomonadota bacterium]|nr:penicillin-binding protein activator [Pseudomonadota bacterium]